MLSLLFLAASALASTPEQKLKNLVKAALNEYANDMPAWLRTDLESNNYTREAIRHLTEPAYFEISWDNVTVQQNLTHGAKKVNEVEAPPEEKEKVNPAVVWQIGKAIWDLVKDNKAVVNYSTDWSGAVPTNVTDWTLLTGWATWASKMYKFKFKNFLGQTLTEFQWKYTCQYGGQYNGKGKYLTLCGASINKIYAYGAYGEVVEASAKGSDPFNYGTADEPIGGMNLQVVMSSNGHFEKTVVGCQITMKGDSTYTVIQCDQN